MITKKYAVGALSLVFTEKIGLNSLDLRITFRDRRRLPRGAWPDDVVAVLMTASRMSSSVFELTASDSAGEFTDSISLGIGTTGASSTLGLPLSLSFSTYEELHHSQEKKHVLGSSAFLLGTCLVYMRIHDLG